MDNNYSNTKTVESSDATLQDALNAAVGSPLDYTTINTPNMIKFLIFSFIGIWVFFVPITIGVQSGVPMVLSINAVKAMLGPEVLNLIVLAIGIMISITFTISRVKKDSFCGRFHAKDGWVTGSLYYISAITAAMVVMNQGFAPILDPNVGGLSINLAGSVFFTVIIAGWLVTFLVEFGSLEFFGTLLEPIMRKVFKLPGQSAVNAFSSFVAAPAVGVFMANDLYKKNIYTHKEACCITTNFSVVSLGFFALLVSITDTLHMYSNLIVVSLVTTFVLAAIVIRIPPMSRKKNIYYNGVVQTEEMCKSDGYSRTIFKKALGTATTKVSTTRYQVFLSVLPGIMSFTIKIVAFVQALSVISTLLAEYTPVFTWLGMPMIPLLELLQLPDAAIIAPSTLVGISEVAMPAILIAGKGVADISVFFILVLSTVQIIFFTESANAMLQTDMDLKFGELVLIFFIRTIIALPIVAIFAHMLY